jgi:Circularly permutated YpsA SLOG family
MLAHVQGTYFMNDHFVIGDHFKIISGGQSGADSAGLAWAIHNGVAHGGWCPKGRRSEEGPIDAKYQLVETPSTSYLQRTEWNARDSDATLIFTMEDRLQGGSKRTAEFATAHARPWLHFRPGVHPKFIARFLEKNSVRVLNIAGSRASSAPGIATLVTEALSAALVRAVSEGESG